MEPRSVFSHICLSSARETLLSREDGTPPIIRLQVLPEGEFPHPTYGKLKWTSEVFDEMIENFNSKAMGADPMLNYDHSTHNWFASEAKAAGWPIKFEKEANRGLFSYVKLTPRAEQAIKDEEYRYISAEVADEMRTSTGRKLKNVLTGMALTNVPFHDTMVGLFKNDPNRESLGNNPICLSRNNDAVFWTPRGKEKKMDVKKLFAGLGGLVSPENRDKLKELAKEVDPDVAETIFDSVEDPSVDMKVAAKPKEDPIPEPKVETLEKEKDSDTIVLSKEEFENFKKAALEGQNANKTLMEMAAKSRVHEFVGPGYIPNNDVALTAATEIALEMPKQFAALFGAIQKAKGQAPVRDIDVLSGNKSVLGGDGVQEFGNEETFVGLVNELVAQNPRLDRMDAMRKVQQERPDLYKIHRSASMKKD